MSTSTDGSSWSSVLRIPLDATSSSFDHFIPGIAVERSTSGSSAHLALTYYYYPNTNCTTSSCQLDVGFTSSANGGSTWTAPVQLAGPITNTWLASTTQGYMVGDYISTSFASGVARPVFASATAPSGGKLNEAIFTSPTAATKRVTGARLKAARPRVLSKASDHAPARVRVRRR
jgi:hypothetical protein